MENSSTRSAAPSVRLIYCLAVAGAVYGAAFSLWTAAQFSGWRFTLPALGVCWTIAIGLWRLAVVATSATRLDAPQYDGAIRIVRILGIIGLAVSAIVMALNLVLRPLVPVLFRDADGIGIMGFVVGAILQVALGLFPPGLLMFELSRLMAFERSLRESNA